MTTKLGIGAIVMIDNHAFRVKKIIIDQYRTKYLVDTSVTFLHLHMGNDEFWESDIDDGRVQII